MSYVLYKLPGKVECVDYNNFISSYLLVFRLCSFFILLISSLVGLSPRNWRPFRSSFPVKTPLPSKSNRLYISAISETDRETETDIMLTRLCSILSFYMA